MPSLVVGFAEGGVACSLLDVGDVQYLLAQLLGLQTEDLYALLDLGHVHLGLKVVVV